MGIDFVLACCVRAMDHCSLDQPGREALPGKQALPGDGIVQAGRIAAIYRCVLMYYCCLNINYTVA